MGVLTDAPPATLAQTLSTWRSVDPPGTLPHLARVLDAESDASPWEVEIDVQLLAIDATSFQAIRRGAEADPHRMAETIAAIVAERGKLQNPLTGSGGVLMGSVREVGPMHPGADLRPGDRVMPLASLIAVPLRLDSIDELNPSSPQVRVAGRAIVTGSMLCIQVPDDLPLPVAVSAFDVFPVASYVREMARPGMHVLVLGAGHAGLLALAAARESLGENGIVSVIDRSRDALNRAGTVDPATSLIEGDVTDTVGTAEAMRQHDLPPADLTLLCTTVAGAEGTAIVCTAYTGAILFFSTATSFAAAALGADAVGSHAQLLIPNGLTDDRGEYAFELLRRNAVLRELFEAVS